MDAVWMIARSRWRGRLGSQVLLAIAIAIVGTAVIATFAGARRTSTSFDRFIAVNAAPDAALDFSRLEQPVTDDQLRALVSLPQVIGSAHLQAMAMAPANNSFQPIAAMIDDGWGTEVDRPRFMQGRMPVADDEMSMDEKRAANLGLELGDTLTMLSYSVEQLQQGALDAGPAGPTVDLRLVGIERSPGGLSSDLELATVTRLPRAFYDRYQGKIGTWAEFVMIDLADDDLAAFTQAVHEIDGLETLAVDPAGVDTTGNVFVTVRFVARTLVVLAVIMLLAGIVVMYVLVARLVVTNPTDSAALTAVGIDRRLRLLANLLEVAPAAAAGAAAAAIGAVFASTMFPFGLAGLAEPEPGLDVDFFTIALGAGALLIVVATATSVAVRQTLRAPRHTSDLRPSPVVDMLVRVGATWPVVTAGRLVLTRGGRTAAVRSAVCGVTIGVAGLTAALIFGTSQASLESTPSRWGEVWDIQINDGTIDKLHGVEPAAFNLVHFSTLEVNGELVEVRAFDTRGAAPMMVVSEGRQAGPGEVVLGERTMRSLGVSLGDRVSITGNLGTAELEVVGTGVFAGVVDLPSLNVGAGVLAESMVGVSDPTADDGGDTLLVAFESDTDRATLLDRLAEAEGLTDAEVVAGVTPVIPDELDRLAEVRPLPWVLAGFLAAIAVLATIALLITIVRRQRHDLAVLRAYGLDTSGATRIVAAQAVGVSITGLALGLPLGVVIGRFVWSTVAGDLGVIVSTSIPWVALGGTIAAVLVVNITSSLAPARHATHTRPAAILRTE